MRQKVVPLAEGKVLELGMGGALRLTPCWKRIAGGCHLDRPIPEYIEEAGFRIDRMESGYFGKPRIASFIYQGAARRV